MAPNGAAIRYKDMRESWILLGGEKYFCKGIDKVENLYYYKK